MIRYPYVQSVRPDRVSILWTTRENGFGQVVYSADRSFSNVAGAMVREFPPAETRMRTTHYQHRADLTGLTPGIEYFYRILVDDQDLTPGDNLQFRTAASGAFNFLVVGDSGLTCEEQLRLSQMLSQERAAFLLHAGDMAYYNGSFEQFQTEYFNCYFQLMKRLPVFPCPGNHEYETLNASPYLAVHAVPADDVPAIDSGRYYSFDWGNVHFISLDSNAPLTSAAGGTGRMLEWLESDLRKTRKFWRVAYFHHPPYASGPNENDAQTQLVQRHLVPILERYDVQVVISGHEHSYQQSKPLKNGAQVEAGLGAVYFTSGGGGANLYPVYPRTWLAYGEPAHHYMRVELQGHRMTTHAIRVDGREIDTVTIAPRPRLTAEGIVNAASFTNSMALGSLISIFGQSFAAEDLKASALPLPTELGEVSVSVNGRRLPLFYVSPGQINAQLPFDLSGSAALRVTTPNGSAEAPLTFSDTAPALFPGASLTHADGSLVTNAAPVENGETVIAYLTGLGPVNGSINAGQAAPSSPALVARGPIEVRLGSAVIAPAFAGLAPGFVGMYQVNFRVPDDLPAGTQPLRIVARGISSNSIGIPVRARISGSS